MTARSGPALLVFGILLGLAGCRRDIPAEALAEARIAHARLLSLARNDGAYAQDLEGKYPRMWAGLGIDTAIPEAPALETLRASLEGLASQHGLTLADWSTTLVESQATPPPARIPADAAWSWHPDQVRQVARVSFTARPADLERLESFFRARFELGRYLVFRKVTLGPEGAEIRLETWSFRKNPPRPEVVPPSFPKRPEGSGDRAEAFDALAREVEGAAPQVKSALDKQLTTVLWDARYRFFLHATEEMKRNRWSHVLR